MQSLIGPRGPGTHWQQLALTSVYVCSLVWSSWIWLGRFPPTPRPQPAGKPGPALLSHSEPPSLHRLPSGLSRPASPCFQPTTLTLKRPCCCLWNSLAVRRQHVKALVTHEAEAWYMTGV